MHDFMNRQEWVRKQYAADNNLNARIALHKRFSTSSVEWTEWVFDQLLAQLTPDATERQTILEVGAGPGNLWAENSHRIPQQWRIHLSDLSAGMVASARQRLANTGISVDFCVASAEELPIAPARCDAIIANHMLYHVPNRDQAITEFRRVLKEGGVIIAATNGLTHMHELHELIRRFDSSYAMDEDFPRHFALENGAEQLGRHFSQVSLVRKENQLVITEGEPLVAYLLSGTPVTIPPERQQELRSFIADELAATGAIRITPETGLLIARNA